MTLFTDTIGFAISLMSIAWNWLDTTSEYFGGYSFLDFLLAIAVFQTVVWFTLRMLDSKSGNAITWGHEPNESDLVGEYAGDRTREDFEENYEVNGVSKREYAYQSSLEGTTENWNMGYSETTAEAARDDIAAELQAEQEL